MPKAIEERNKEWVAYGEDNDYYRFLIDNYLQSATNNAAIGSISNLIYGEGLCIEDMEKEDNEVKALRDMIPAREIKKVILERKMLGQAAMQVIYNKGGRNRKVVKIKHFPIHTLRPEKANEVGVIENYYYHPDWVNKKTSDVLKRIPTFGNSTDKIELFILKPYVSGYTYFSPVDYSGSLPYCELENEIADYLLNEAKNSFSGTKVINFNNGIPSNEQRDAITRDVKQKLTGSRGQKVIVAFNETGDNKATVEDISLNDAPSHYEYLANEAMHKILIGHKVTSPMLLGIKDGGNGLASNADEIKNASQLFDSTVIRIYQNEVIDALEEVLELNGEVPEMYFITSQPIEFTEENQEDDNDYDPDNDPKGKKEKTEKEKDMDKEQNLSSDTPNFNPEEQVEWLTYLSKNGETIEELEGEYELVQSKIDENETEDENWEQMLNEGYNLSQAPAGNKNSDSVQDNKWIKVRYAYVQGSRKHGTSKSKKQRPFCRAMEAANRVYRKEDILKMQADGVNSKLGHNKQPYSIWLHAGGVNCHHKWERRIYMKREKINGEPYGGGALTGTKKATAAEAKKKGFSPKYKKFKNDKRVAEAAIDRSDKGHHPSYVKPKKK